MVCATRWEYMRLLIQRWNYCGVRWLMFECLPDIGWRYSEDINSMTRFLCSQTITIALQCMFCSWVTRSSWNGEQTLNTTNKYDDTVMSRSHWREKCLSKQNGTEIIGLKHPFFHLRSCFTTKRSDSKAAAYTKDVHISEKGDCVLWLNRCCCLYMCFLFEFIVLFDIYQENWEVGFVSPCHLSELLL